MIKNPILIILLFLLSGIARAESYSEWETEEKIQFTTFTALSIIDYSQTSWAMKQKDEQGNYLYTERNPFLGNRPSDAKLAAYQLVAIGGMYYTISEYGDKHRKLRWILIAVKAAAVIHNDRVGISIHKVW